MSTIKKILLLAGGDSVEDPCKGKDNCHLNNINCPLDLIKQKLSEVQKCVQVALKPQNISY